MTRIGVISDTHGGKVHLERFAQLCEAEKFDEIYHLGDVLDDARWLEKRLNRTIASVAGNCDYLSRHQREARLRCEGKRILLVHGDRHNVKWGYDNLSYYAEENQMDIVLFGHTHKAIVEYRGKVLMINPGALKNGSACILELTQKDIVPKIIDVDAWYEGKA